MQHSRSGNSKIRVVVVDDSPLMLKMISSGLEQDGDIDVVATAQNPIDARSLIKAHDPDLITLDVEMPGMNGIEFLEKIMTLRPMPVIMVSTLTEAGADVTLQALQIGAVDAVAKPVGRQGLAEFGEELRRKARAASTARVQKWVPPTSASATLNSAALRLGKTPSGCKLIAIGASTGGVSAIHDVLSGLPVDLPPIVITQHMPPQFTTRFADRLNNQLGFDVAEATEGEALKPGAVRIAPGDAHLCVARNGNGLEARLDRATGPISGHVPSVDVLFNSVCTAVGGATVGIILTGMGRDGAAGLRAMRNAGSMTFGEAESSCTVYGMPRVAMSMNAVIEELHIRRISGRLCDFLNTSAVKERA
ncbi:protein-glutamate methylesterase/protein-glutamine glutaminase [Halovulum sp. GXIMD14793]